MFDELRSFLDKKNIINLLIAGILILGIPLAVQLVKQQQLIKSRADVIPVEVVEDGTRVVKRVINGRERLVATTQTVTVRLRTPAEFLSASQATNFGVGTVYAGHTAGTEGWYCDNNQIWHDRPDGEHELTANCTTQNATCTPIPPPAGYTQDAECRVNSPSAPSEGQPCDSNAPTTGCGENNGLYCRNINGQGNKWVTPTTSCTAWSPDTVGNTSECGGQKYYCDGKGWAQRKEGDTCYDFIPCDKTINDGSLICRAFNNDGNYKWLLKDTVNAKCSSGQAQTAQCGGETKAWCRDDGRWTTTSPTSGGTGNASCFLSNIPTASIKVGEEFTAVVRLSREPAGNDRVVINWGTADTGNTVIAPGESQYKIARTDGGSQYNVPHKYTQAGIYTITASLDDRTTQKTLCNNISLSDRQKQITVVASTITPTPTPRVTPSPTAGPTASPTSSPTAAPTASPRVRVERFKISEDLASLDGAPEFPFTGDGMTVDFPFLNTTPGEKFIFIRFIGSNGRTVDKQTTVLLVGPDPVITNLGCNVDVQNNSLIFTATGFNFGTRDFERSSLAADGSPLEIREWISLTPGPQAGRVIARLLSPPDVTLGHTYVVTLTRGDGVRTTSTCNVGTTTVAFSTKMQCRVPGQFSASNVDVKIFGTSPNPILRQKINIDKDGNPQGFTPKLELNKVYTLIVKPPGTLAKRQVFQTGSGGTVNLEPITLPVGDIGPRESPDGVVNAIDASELKRQWSLVTDVVRTGDFNQDSRINSLDYSCLIKNINASDELFTQPAVVSPSSNTTTNTTTNKKPIKSEWAVNMDKVFVKIKSFYEKQFNNNIEITYQVIGQPIKGNLNIEEYYPFDLAKEVKDKNQNLLRSGAHNVWMIYLVRDSDIKLNLKGGGLGGLATLNAATQYEFWLDNEAVNSNTYGVTGAAHEFGHALGIPHPWELPANVNNDKNFGNVPGDIMAYSPYEDLEKNYIRDDVKKEMGL